MKNQKLLLAGVIMFMTGLNAIAQTNKASVKWGPELKGSRRGTISETIGFDETGYYVRGIEKGDVYLEKLDKNLNKIATWEFEEKDPETKQKFNFEGVTFFGGKLMLFQTNIDKKNDVATLFFKNVNTKTMVADGKMNKLMETEYHKVGGLFSMASLTNLDKFSIIKSREDDKLLIISKPTIENKEANDKFGLAVLDTNLNISWKKDIELPYQNTLFFTQKWIVDDAGNVYVLGKLYNEKVKEVRRGVQNFTYHIIAFSNKGENKMDYEVKIAEKFVTDISIAVKDGGDIVCAGFYSKIGRTSVDGCFYMTLDPKSKNVKVNSIKEFDIDFLTAGMTERQEKKAKKREEKGKDQELFEYDLDNIILRDDGGCVLVGEQYYSYTVTHSNGKYTYTTTYYNYNDIVVINVTPDGKIEWAQKVPKRQQTANDGGFYSSYALAVTKDKIRLIFNDHKDNLQPKKQGDWENFSLKDKNGIVTIVTIDKAGQVYREPLFSLAETEVAIRPKVCEQFNDDQMLLFGEKGKLEQFAIVSFK